MTTAWIVHRAGKLFLARERFNVYAEVETQGDSTTDFLMRANCDTKHRTEQAVNTTLEDAKIRALELLEELKRFP